MISTNSQTLLLTVSQMSHRTHSPLMSLCFVGLVLVYHAEKAICRTEILWPLVPNTIVWLYVLLLWALVQIDSISQKWRVIYACSCSYWLMWTIFIFVSHYLYFSCNDFLSWNIRRHSHTWKSFIILRTVYKHIRGGMISRSTLINWKGQMLMNASLTRPLTSTVNILIIR